MPVSPADFYAYSQATGVQVPDSPEERAQLAPRVLEFRRSQLKQPQEGGFDPMSMGVGIGLALAGAGAGALALRGRNKIPKSTKTTGQSGINVKDLNREDLNRAMNVGKSKEPTRQEAYARSAAKPESELPPATKPVSGANVDLITDPNTGEKFASGRSPYTETDRAQQLVNEYRQNIVDREIRREERNRNKIDALYAREGNKIIDELRAETKEEDIAAKRQRIAQNQQKDINNIRQNMSDVVDSVIDEDVYEQLPSSVIKLASDIQNPNVPLTSEIVDNYKNWAQTTFANDPVVLSEILGDLERLPSTSIKNTSDLASQVDEAAQVISQNALTDFQKRQAPALSDQQINAVGSGEDQMTGRVRQQLQRNEDLNLMQIDALEDVNQQVAPSSSDTPITQASAQTADGIPVDQAEGIASQATPNVKNFIIEQRRKVWDEMANDHDFDPVKYPAPTHARVEAELGKRLGPGAYKFGPSFSANRQAMEIYAMTGDRRVVAKEFGLSPVTFETFENMPEAKARAFESGSAMSTEGYPSENLTPVIEKTGIKVNVPGMGEVDLADLRKPFITESTATSAEDFYQNQISKRKDWLTGVEADIAEKYEGINEVKRQEIVNQLEKVETYLDQAVSQGNTKLANSMRARKQKLENQFEDPSTYVSKDPDVYKEDNLLKARLRGAQNKAQEMLTETDDIKKYPTTIDWSGGTPRVFGEQDPLTGEFIPETMELRSDRRVLDTTPKGGGGRNVAEYTAGERIDEEIRNIQGGGRIRDYDLETGAATSPWGGDRTQTGREVDIYGIRLSGQKQADPEVRPSEPKYTKQEIADEAVRLSSAAEEGDVPIAPAYEDVIESLGSQPKTEAAKRSVLMSEAVRKAARQRAERNPMAGKIPQELEILRRTMPEVTATDYLGQAPRTRVAGLPPQQRTIPGVTGYGARQRKSPADVASEQLESYMKKRMAGRSTPLTSQAVIQPKLF